MANKRDASEVVSADRAAEEPNGAARKPPEIANLLGKVEQLLEEGQPGKAFELIRRAKVSSSWATNALGVCQLRLGNAKVAVDVFRGLVLGAGGIVLRNDVPAAYKTNYATALLLADNLRGCLSVLAEIKEEEHPAAGRLHSAIRRWKERLTLWQKISWYLGEQPDRPVLLDFPLGDLE